MGIEACKRVAGNILKNINKIKDNLKNKKKRQN